MYLLEAKLPTDELWGEKKKWIRKIPATCLVGLVQSYDWMTRWWQGM